MKTALVLSGGGMFGAWQAGAWRALAGRFSPDLIVGASVGALNGYAIAAGASADDLCNLWLHDRIGVLRQLPRNVQDLMESYRLSADFAVVITDLLRMKPGIVRGEAVTWRHLAASCAIPGVLRQYRIESRWYGDGGLLNPLPLWAAAELGATRILALHALPEIPSRWLKPLAAGFRRTLGHHPPLPAGIAVRIVTAEPLGSVRDALRWKRENIERWMQTGFEAAKNVSVPDCFER